jgi:hypothetical protein
MNMKAKPFTLFLLSIAVGLAVVLGGCRPSEPTVAPAPPAPTVVLPEATSVPPMSTALPPTPTATPTPVSEPPEALQATLWQLASQFRVSMDQVHLVRWEQVDWPDGCLGVPMRDACTQAIVPGYRIVVEVGDQEYEYHSTLPDAQPYHLLLAARPEIGIEEPALVWEGQEEGRCRSLILAADGRAAMGPCDAPHVLLPLLEEMDRPQQWADLLARFAPFEAETPSGWVRFQGQGPEVASPAWQRAVAVWVRLVRQELVFGRSGASWGAALAWHREMPGRPGYCQFLQVEMYGLAYASVARCGGGDAQDLGRGWLETAEWEQFDAWFYGRAPVYQQGLEFFSAGTQEMSESEVAELGRWCEAVYTKMATKRYTSADGWSFDYPANWDRVEPAFVQETLTGKTVQFGSEPTTKSELESWIESEIARKLDAAEAGSTLEEPLAVSHRGNLIVYRYTIRSRIESSETLLKTTVFFDGTRRYEFYTAIPPVTEEEVEAILDSFRVGQQ